MRHFSKNCSFNRFGLLVTMISLSDLSHGIRSELSILQSRLSGYADLKPLYKALASKVEHALPQTIRGLLTVFLTQLDPHRTNACQLARQQRRP